MCTRINTNVAFERHAQNEKPLRKHLFRKRDYINAMNRNRTIFKQTLNVFKCCVKMNKSKINNYGSSRQADLVAKVVEERLDMRCMIRRERIDPEPVRAIAGQPPLVHPHSWHADHTNHGRESVSYKQQLDNDLK